MLGVVLHSTMEELNERDHVWLECFVGWVHPTITIVVVHDRCFILLWFLM
jgi:hypothetical protein